MNMLIIRSLGEPWDVAIPGPEQELLGPSSTCAPGMAVPCPRPGGAEDLNLCTVKSGVVRPREPPTGNPGPRGTL